MIWSSLHSKRKKAGCHANYVVTPRHVYGYCITWYFVMGKSDVIQASQTNSIQQKRGLNTDVPGYFIAVSVVLQNCWHLFEGVLAIYVELLQKDEIARFHECILCILWLWMFAVLVHYKMINSITRSSVGISSIFGCFFPVSYPHLLFFLIKCFLQKFSITSIFSLASLKVQNAHLLGCFTAVSVVWQDWWNFLYKGSLAIYVKLMLKGENASFECSPGILRL